MQGYHYRAQQLYLEDCALNTIVEAVGTPCFVYSAHLIQQNYQALQTALQGLNYQCCYAVKANSNLAILNLLAQLGAGFDIVSGGELARIQHAVSTPVPIVFSGVGKNSTEIQAALEANISCFNIESMAELQRLAAIAELRQVIIPIALRINPDIDASTHPYITTGRANNKFGINSHEAMQIARQLKSHPRLKLQGLAMHIGSQITDLSPFAAALRHLRDCYNQLHAEGIILQSLDIGWGLGINYHNETIPSFVEYAALIRNYLQALPVKIILAPGRAVVGNSGSLITQVEYLKSNQNRQFAVVDAGMTELLRPALYQAYHEILPLQLRHGVKTAYDIVGPVCESADCLGRDRDMVLVAGDYLAIQNCGAYAFSMSSQYNSRPRPPEILITNDRWQIIRQRETYADLYQSEILA